MANSLLNRFEVKQYEMHYLSEVYKTLERELEYVREDYRPIRDTDVQETDRDGNLKWQDDEHTIPIMKKEWGTVTKTDDELTDEDKAKIAAIQNVMEKLEKMI